MASQNQPDRWKSSLLAATLAVAGAPFLFDRLGALMRVSLTSLSAALHSAPVLLVVAGAVLLLADEGAKPRATGKLDPKESQDEL